MTMTDRKAVEMAKGTMLLEGFVYTEEELADLELLAQGKVTTEELRRKCIELVAKKVARQISEKMLADYGMARYEDILTKWSDIIYAKIDKTTVRIDNLENKELRTYKHGMHKGFIDGLCVSLTVLSMLEKGRKVPI